MATNEAWLAQVEEVALDPTLPIIDTHHHLWDYRDGRGERRYLMDELQRDLQTGHNIVATIFIECRAMYRGSGSELMKPVGEIEFVNGIAAMAASGLYGNTRVAAGIMGFAELQDGDRVKSVLEAQIAAAPDRFRGIRRTGAWDPDPRVTRAKTPGLFLDRKFREGFAALASFNLVFEAVCRHPQLAEVVDLARAFPDSTIVLNHLGGVVGIGPYAGQRDEIFAEWSNSVAALAECSNIIIKLGGINMDYSGFGWHEKTVPPTSEALYQETRQYYDTAIEHFGTDRCMFESNFPVDKISCSYPVLWNAFKRMTANYSEDERSKLFHDNAKRVYRL